MGFGSHGEPKGHRKEQGLSALIRNYGHVSSVAGAGLLRPAARESVLKEEQHTLNVKLTFADLKVCAGLCQP